LEIFKNQNKFFRLPGREVFGCVYTSKQINLQFVKYQKLNEQQNALKLTFALKNVYKKDFKNHLPVKTLSARQLSPSA